MNKTKDYDELLDDIVEKMKPINLLSRKDKIKLEELGLLEEFYKEKNINTIREFNADGLAYVLPYSDVKSFFIGLVPKDCVIKVNDDVNHVYLKIKCNEKTSLKSAKNIVDLLSINNIYVSYGLEIDNTLDDNSMFIAYIMLFVDSNRQVCDFDFKEYSVYHEETIRKLESIFMFKEIKKYVEVPSLINIDLFNLNDLFLGKEIILVKQGTYCLDEFDFSSRIPENSLLFVGIDANQSINLKMVDKIIDEIKSKCSNVEIAYATYFDNTLRDGLFKLNIINTIVTSDDNFNGVIEIVIDEEEKELANYDLDEIYRKCQSANDFSINYIQEITNVGFGECFKIKQKIKSMFK